VVLVVAKIGGELAIRAGQPPVLGELLAGVVVGNIALTGFTGFEGLKHQASLELFAELGVLILLFEVGLESSVPQMLRVGFTAFSVAVLGVVAPFALGWAVSAWLSPEASVYLHAFIGATLCATSVGITARVLQDLGRSKELEARVILGAAVIDDVLGLVILSAVTGLILAADRGEPFSTWTVLAPLAKAVVFLAGSLTLGVALVPRILRAGLRVRVSGVLLALSLAFCFALSGLAALIGLAPIVGAFAAGLILEPIHYKEYVERGEHSLEVLVHPIGAFLIPVFFVLIGVRTDLRTLADPGILVLAGALTIAAILGKQACSLGVIGTRADRLTIGLGMIPRGEVGLIFANIGLSLTIAGERIVDDATFSAIVVMVIVTTLATPPALKWRLSRVPRAS